MMVEMQWFAFCHVILKTKRSESHVTEYVGALMVSHCPDKFGGGRYFGSEDMFLVVEVQDFTCSLKSVLTVFL